MIEEKNNKIDDSQFHFPHKDKYESLKKLIYSAVNQLEKIQNVIESMEQEERKVYYQAIPGTEGKFDGQYLIAEDGRKTEVPENYAAKSRLVYGDVLKVFSDSGKQVFKQIDRVERKKIEGVLAKKEGKWYMLSDTGSYRISDASAEFNNAQLNDKATAYIPSDNINAPWAALDEVFGDKAKRGQFTESKNATDVKYVKNTAIEKEITPVKIVERKKEVKREEKSFKPKFKPLRKSPTIVKKEENKTDISRNVSKEYVDNILDDDDLR